MTIRLALCAWCLLLFASCEKSDDAGGDVDSIDLSIGSAWTYRWHLAQYSSAGDLLWDTAGTYIVVVSAIGQTVGPYQGLTLLEARNQDLPSQTSAVWYSQSDERLTEVAYRLGQTPLVLPKGSDPWLGKFAVAVSPIAEPLAIQRRLGSQLMSDSIQLRDDPRIVYLYPMSGGTSWVSFTSPFLQERTVEGYEDLRVQGGQYHCAKIRTRIPTFVPDLDWIDYVSSQGLVMRTFDAWVRAGEMEEPDFPGDSIRVIESLELVAH